MEKIRWNSRVVPTAASLFVVVGAVWMSGCDSRQGQVVGPAQPPATQALATPKPLTPVVFDSSTTVSEMENVLGDDRPTTELIPLAQQVKAGVNSYYESLAEPKKAEFTALVDAIRKSADMIAGEAERGNREAALNAMVKLRDEQMTQLRKMDRGE